MSTFKSDVFELCKEVAAEFSGWGFGSGQFKDKSLKHTDLVVHLGFGFEYDATPVYPSINVFNRRVSKLCRHIFGTDGCTSIVNMQVVAHMLNHTPEKLRTGFWVVRDKKNYLSLAQPSQAVVDITIDIADARPVLTETLRDAISFIENHYDLSSEDALLRGLPAKYATRHVNSPYDQFEKMKGVMLCLVHILLGDFDFVESYRDNGYETIFPKRIQELDKIIGMLPELKRRYAETGSVI
jgi:hypothetical protein